MQRTTERHRVLKPREVAQVIAFLCSDGAEGVDGEAITVGLGSMWYPAAPSIPPPYERVSFVPSYPAGKRIPTLRRIRRQ